MLTLPWEATAGLSLHIFGIFSQARVSPGHKSRFRHCLTVRPSGSGKAVLHVNWFEPLLGTPNFRMGHLFPIIAAPFVSPEMYTKANELRLVWSQSLLLSCRK